MEGNAGRSAGRPLVVICGPGAPESALDEIVRSRGFDLQHVSSVENMVAAASDDASVPPAFLLGVEPDTDVSNILQGAAEVLPSPRFVVFSHSQAGEPAESFSELPGADQILWIGRNTDPQESLNAFQCFLEADGYLWASQVEPEHARRLFLTGSLGEDEERSPARTKWLGSFVEQLSTYNELEPMLAEALRGTMEALQCRAGTIYLWDEQKEMLVLKVAHGPDREQRLGLRQKMGEGLAGWVAEVGEAILVLDARRVDRLKDRRRERYSDPSCMACPLMHGDKLLGVLCVTMRNLQGPFQPADLRLARDIGQEVGSVMSPLCVMSELRQLNKKLMGLFRRSSDFLRHKASQLAETRALSADVLNGIPIGVIAYDRNLRVRSTNVAARRFLDRDGLGHRVPLERRLETDSREWRHTLRNVITAGQQFRKQRAQYQCGDRQLSLDIHGAPLHDSEGAIIGGVLTVQDVTKDVEMEEKLVSAERLAAVGKITAKVAHELNNPLDGILRFLSLALRTVEEEPSKATDYLKECRQGLLRMSNTLTQLLAFSRSKNKSQQPVSVSQTIRDCLSLYGERMRSSKVELDLDVPDSLPPSPVPELFEALSNVVKNALDAVGEEGKLTVTAADEGDQVNIIVSDDGPGVSEENRHKVFEPFFTTKVEGASTGLGLALCRDALRRTGGEIQLLPSARGATFQITVPTEQQTQNNE